MAMRKPRVSVCVAAWLACACAAAVVLDGVAIATSIERGVGEGVELAVPGDDLPSVGRSLFDHLTAVNRGGVTSHDVPYPFTALLDRIARELDGAQSPPGVKRVLIPLGRSLQRSAAAPQYFAFPRVVAAVDGEPAASSRFYLKDRLYLGYQQKANLIEVISYNEVAGRFEFQLVRNYGPAQTPEIVYANRVICTSCHQNGAPIFSRQQWDETSANPDVAAMIRASGGEIHGVDLERGVDVPFAIDNATDRANRFAASQLVWREGCGDNGAAAQRCRAALWLAALKYRLSGNAPVAGRSAEFDASVVAPLAASAKARWPSGLAIPDPDIPNRNPLSSSGASKSLPQVEAAFDPLAPRGALETWAIDGAAFAPRFVGDLAEFVSAADIARVDAKLASLRSRAASARTTFKARCDVRRIAPQRSRESVDFDCVTEGRDARSRTRVQARVETGGGRPAAMALTRLQLPDQPPMLDLSSVDIRATTRTSSGVVQAALRRGALHARTADGDAVERVTLRWDGATGGVEVSIAADSVALESAVAALLREGVAGRFDGFEARPFRRAKLIPALLTSSGAPTSEACCLADAALPPARVDAVAAAGIPAVARDADSVELAALQRFYRYCSACHLTRESSPPNFLAGDAASVRERMSQCAPRIFARLGMWQRPFDPHAKTPMPPEVALRRYQLTAETWRASDDLAVMSSYAAKLAEVRTGRAPDRADALARNYEELPSCLPVAGSRHAASVR